MKQPSDAAGLETELVERHTEPVQLDDFVPKQYLLEIGRHRQLIVQQAKSTPCRVVPADRDQDAHLGHALLLQRLMPAMARDQLAVLVDNDRANLAKLAIGGADLVDLLLRVPFRVPLIGTDALDRPDLLAHARG